MTTSDQFAITSKNSDSERTNTINDLLSDLPNDQWVPLPATGWRLPARYKHAAEVVEGKLYIIGGSRNGRYLSDIQVFDLATLTWSTIKLSGLEVSIPALSGHKLISWGRKLFVIGRHSKENSDSIKVWSLDLETGSFSCVETGGKIPSARGGHSVTLVGSKLVIFGGEDKYKNILNDLHVLDLENMSWDSVKVTRNSPPPRFDHAAAVHADRYLIIFGGSSHSTCFNDLHVLDLDTMEWSEPLTRGDTVGPRAGHAGAVVEGMWYIVGGGDNKTGARETMKLNMGSLVWSTATSVPERDPLASEGVSVCSVTVDQVKLLVAFGGYNGKYHNEVFILKCKVNASKPRHIVQSAAAAAAAASVSAAFALVNAAEVTMPETSIDQMVDLITAEKKEIESKVGDLRSENQRLRVHLEEAANLHGELSTELQSVQDQLHAERSRCSKLEIQIEEMQRRLGILPSVELELEALRREKPTWQPASPKPPSSGLWPWAAGSS